MRDIFICLIALWSLSSCVIAGDENTRSSQVSLTLLIEALDKGGIDTLNTYLDSGGKWPRITTDSFAMKERITQQKELVALSDRLIHLLRERAEAEPASDVNTLEIEALLLFSLGEKLWLADGYRNRVVALLCREFATYRCGKIVILSQGEKMGPACPPVFNVRSSGDMLSLFIWGIPEIAPLSESGLKEKLQIEPVTGESWLEMLSAIRKIDLGGLTVGEKFNDSVSLRMDLMGTIASSENLSSLIFHQGWSHVVHNSMLPALAIYIKNKGSLETLRMEPVNATKFKKVMKNEARHFSTKPVMWGKVGGDQLAGLVEDLQSQGGVAKRLFGSEK
jgi:hypothetical protein